MRTKETHNDVIMRSMDEENRLRLCLSEAKLYNGETPHSFRIGLSNTLSVLGCSPEEIAQYLE